MACTMAPGAVTARSQGTRYASIAQCTAYLCVPSAAGPPSRCSERIRPAASRRLVLGPGRRFRVGLAHSARQPERSRSEYRGQSRTGAQLSLSSRCRCRQVEHQQPQQVVQEPRASAVRPQNQVADTNSCASGIAGEGGRPSGLCAGPTFAQIGLGRQRSSTRTCVAEPPERTRRGAPMSAGTAAAYTRGDGRLYLQDGCRTAAWVTAR